MKKLPWMMFAGAVVFGLIFRSLFPRIETVVTPPRIRTQYDTVRVLDTAWVTKLVTKTKWDTVYTERAVVAKPDTVWLIPKLTGLTALSVPEKTGDSTTAQGFTIEGNAADSSASITPWYGQWWTAGPLKAFSTDTFPPRISFYLAPKKARNCGLFCKIGHYTVGGAAGYLACQVTK